MDSGTDEEEDDYDEEEVKMKNQYDRSKALVVTEPASALSGFAEVVKMSSEKTRWGSKALKQTVKIYFRLGEDKKMMAAYRELLTYIKAPVTCHFRKETIFSVIRFVSKPAIASRRSDLLEEFYQTTLDALDETKHASLWFLTNLNLCKYVLFSRGRYRHMLKILDKLHQSCQKKDGTDDPEKGTQLLEVYANKFLVYIETKDNEKMQQLYQKALAIEPDKLPPRNMGIIRECGGKMHMVERQWAEAATNFIRAFKIYDEIDQGDERRIRCLKYFVLTKMLMESEVNPFDNHMVKANKDDPEILTMRNLIAAYRENQFTEFERILKSNWKKIVDDDPFIRTYMEDLLKKARTPALQKLMETNTETSIAFISKELNMPEKEVTELLLSLILDGQIDCTINEMKGLLVKSSSANEKTLYRDC